MLVCALLMSCRASTSLERMYCEGGVRDGRSDGGDCLVIDDNKPDQDPRTIGSALLTSRYKERFTLRTAEAGAFELHRDGKLAGVIEKKHGSWIAVKLADSPHVISLRSDTASIFR